MSACDRSACCQVLPDKKNLEGIIGVGVLLQSISDPRSDCESGLFCGDVSFVLNSRSKEVKKCSKKVKRPCMNLVGSIVLVAKDKVGIEQQSRCVRVEFWRLKPYVARFLSENCLNEMSWYLIRKLNNLFKKKESSDPQKQHNSTAKGVFEVWYLADEDSMCCGENLDDDTGDKASDFSISEAASETSDRESESVKFECEIRYSCADSESKDWGCNLKVVDLWAEARSIAYKISMLKNDSVKHFGYLVPRNEIGWVKAGYYRSLPIAYKKKFKNERKKKSQQYFGDYLEEKARKNVWFRFWWHPISQSLFCIFIVLIAITTFYTRLFGLDRFLVDKFDNLASSEAGLIALVGIIFIMFLLIWEIYRSVKTFSFRKHADKSRKRRLKKWRDSNE